MLAKLLATGRPLLADGATGVNLFEAGFASGESLEAWNKTHWERIRARDQAFVDAGSDIVLTNSLGANRRRLMPRDLQVETRELARIARGVADKAARPLVGSLGRLVSPPAAAETAPRARRRRSEGA